jgi:hypothetical protein
MTAPQPARRCGIATLEIVLVFPMLLALVAAIFLVGRADATKSLTATRARDEAWKKRPTADPGEVLRLLNDPIVSAVATEEIRAVSPGPLFRGTNFQARTRAEVTGRPWDRRDIPFDPGRATFDPHREELGRIADNLPLLRTLLNLELMLYWLLAPDRNPGLGAIAVVGKVANVLVRVAGIILKLVASPAVAAAKIAVEILKIPLYPIAWISKWARRMIRYFDSVIRMMNIGLNAFDSLYEASQGRPGGWRPGDYLWLGGFRP